MKDDRFIIVAMNADACEVVPAGTVFDRVCGKCGVRVSLAPSSQRVLKEKPEIPVVCMECFGRIPPGEVAQVRHAGTREEVFREHRSVVPNMRRHRN